MFSLDLVLSEFVCRNNEAVRKSSRKLVHLHWFIQWVGIFLLIQFAECFYDLCNVHKYIVSVKQGQLNLCLNVVSVDKLLPVLITLLLLPFRWDMGSAKMSDYRSHCSTDNNKWLYSRNDLSKKSF